MFSIYIYALTPRGSHLNAVYELRAMHLWKTVLARFWANGLIPIPARQCSTKKCKTSARQVGITLVDLSSAFLILGTGVGLGLLSFLVEINSTEKFTRNRRKRSVIVV